MPTYKVEASKLVYYQLNIEANSEQEALDEVKNMNDTMDIEDFWDGEEALQIDKIELVEN